jgi:SAM-dependent methyltransferase
MSRPVTVSPPAAGAETVFDRPRREFYEGRWAEPDRSDGSLRNWLVKKERFFLRRLPRGGAARVLDLGCGGGWARFAAAGRTVGVDMSPQSLRGAQAIYHGVAACDLTHLPWRDASFDLVVSSDVLGHLPLDVKQQAMDEIYRVTKPGGRTLHYIEAEGDDPLTRFAKADPALYRRRIIGPEGHEGIESPAATAQRFRQAGFTPVTEQPVYRLLMYPPRVVQLYANEYARRSALLGAWVAVCKAVTAVAPLALASSLVTAVVLEVTDRLLPPSWGSGLLVEYRKPQEA